MAPEYISTRKASKESDVYSFGVVVLEIAIGRRAIHLPKVYDEKQAECLIVVGLWCAHSDQNLRPSVRQVIRVNFEAAMPTLPLNMPVAVCHVPYQSTSSGEPSFTTIIGESG
ncbi:hypothetical protein Nepgr_026503 [Nepenthes gracilis]|uniref:Protein kinase domain-containing protein n=1 Tax=Nepenthes gracilis TaxID=150966 RepID=A0AAD3Y238_NEPGR|nr:hypothetical protein Nepgr_026503 [Nepenthes gracilis]